MITGQTYQTIGEISKYNFLFKVKGFRIVSSIAVFLLMSGISQRTSGQAWYNANWGFRKSHVITGAAGAGTNYQVRIIAHKGTGLDIPSDVYLGANVKDDFGDVRFTAADGTTLQDFWMETGSLVSGSQAAFWVEVTANLNTNQNIYIYYGNNSAATTSDGVATFLLFDDFTGVALDGTKWTKRNGGTPSFSGGLMTIPTITSDPSKIIATGGPTADNNAIVARFQVTAGTNTDERAGLGVRTANATSPVGYNYIFHNFTSLSNIDFLNDQVTYGTPVSFSWSKNTFYTMEAFTNGTNIYGRVNYGSWNSQSISSLLTPTRGTNYLALNIGSFTGATTVWDWAFIRKAQTTEPANSTWAAEQAVPPSITGFSPGNACQGIAVVITGLNFTGATAVSFNGASATYTIDNATQITATVPFSATTGSISVTTPGGTAGSASFTVKQSPVASVVAQSNITCNSSSDGTITVGASGGAGGYTFSVNNGANYLPPTGTNQRLFAGLAPNNPYKIRVMDSMGCESKSAQ